MDNKTEGQKLQEALGYKQKNAWENSSEEYRQKAYVFCDSYRDFLNRAKTEREFVKEAEMMLKAKGFVPLSEIKDKKGRLHKGMKIYEVNRNKSIIVSVIGENPVSDGVNLLGAHIDSPRLDLKPNPLYEDTDMAMLETHYYGGIKKYQWVTIPLSIHGVIYKNNGEAVNIVIGEDEKDPVFTITDLLPHLAYDQMQKKMSEGITGEGLNVLFGSIPYNDEKVKEKVKLNILKTLHDKYGIVEEDFVSAELEIVPAMKARDVGLDRSMIGSYGQDDRVCAYTALKAIMDIDQPKRTCVCILSDKEEIGSMGNTGARSRFLENHIASLCAYSTENYNDVVLRNALNKSKMLSADVNAAVDPNYQDVFEKKNATYLGKGIVLQKYTGARGKVDASDANPEFISELRRIFNENNIVWQTGELGKVDQGGGGTIAQYVADLGVEVIDCGVALLSMHSPFEITSKIDIYTTYNAYKVFLEKVI